MEPSPSDGIRLSDDRQFFSDLVGYVVEVSIRLEISVQIAIRFKRDDVAVEGQSPFPNVSRTPAGHSPDCMTNRSVPARWKIGGVSDAAGDREMTESEGRMMIPAPLHWRTRCIKDQISIIAQGNSACCRILEHLVAKPSDQVDIYPGHQDSFRAIF